MNDLMVDITTITDNKYPDGRLELTLKNNPINLIIYLPALEETGIQINHDGRLHSKKIEEHIHEPIIVDKIRINITGWFHIYYKLIIKTNEKCTYLACVNKKT